MNDISRRTFLSRASALTAAALALPDLTARASNLLQSAGGQPTGPPLGQVAEQKGIFYGAATQKGILQKDPAFASLFNQQCKVLAPEWETKHGTVEPHPHQFDFSLADWLVNYALQHNMIANGAGLIWHNGLPDWFQSYVNQQNVQQIMTEYITATVKHFAGRMHAWAVVNEVMDPRDNRPDGLRATRSGYWLQLMGPGYIESAFRIAAAADPRAKLIWNVNFIEDETDPLQGSKRQSLLKWFTDFKRRGVPLDGVGIQSHLIAGHNIAGPQFQSFLQQVADLGMQIYITELDVDDHELPSDVNIRDQKVADTYYHYLSTVLKEKASVSIVTWGLSDRYGIIGSTEKRKDNMPARTLLFDTDLQPKKAYYAVQRAFMEAAPR